MSIYTSIHTYLSQVDESALNDALGLSNHYYNLTVSDLEQTIGDHVSHVPAGLTFKGRKHSESTKQKMSVSISKAMKASPNARSKDQRGSKNPFYGKTHTEEVRRAISERNKKRKYKSGYNIQRPEEANIKLSNTAQGRFRMYKSDGSWTWGYPKK